MEQITVRVEADTLEELEAEAEDAGQSRSDYIREVLGSRHESDVDVERMRAEIEALEAEVAELEGELAEERSRADRLEGARTEYEDLEERIDKLETELIEVRSERDELAGELNAKEDTIQAKEDHIESLESTVYEQQQAVNAAASGSVFGRIRSALPGGSDQDSE